MTNRERDAKIAESLGYVVDPPAAPGEMVVRPDWGILDEECNRTPLPYYTTDDAAALELVKETQKKGYEWCIKAYSARTGGGAYADCVEPRHHQLHPATARTIAEAICTAWERMKGEKEER